MSSIKRNLLVEQGATFSYSIPLIDSNLNPYPVDTSGWSVVGKIKKYYNTLANAEAGMVAVSSSNTDVVGNSTSFTTLFSPNSHLSVFSNLVFQTDRRIVSIANDEFLSVSTAFPFGNAVATYTQSRTVDFDTTLVSGNLTISLLADATWVMEPTRYVYDVILTSNTGAITRIQEGIFTLSPSVS